METVCNTNTGIKKKTGSLSIANIKLTYA